MHKRLFAIIIAFAMLIALVGCRENKEEILADFQNLIETPVSSESIAAVSVFLDEYIDDVDTATAELMVGKYREYLYDYIIAKKDKTTLQELTLYIDKDTGDVDSEKIKNSSHEEYVNNIYKAGLLLNLTDEELELKIDYGSIIERYEKYMPESMRVFYELEKKISLAPATKNAKLIIPWEELLDRALQVEYVLTEYPDDEIIRQDALWLFKKYLSMLLIGTTNSPMFDYTTKEFSEEILAIYKKFIKDEPDTTLSWVLCKYIEYLNGIDYIMDFNDSSLGKSFFNTCDVLVSEAEKRVNSK